MCTYLGVTLRQEVKVEENFQPFDPEHFVFFAYIYIYIYIYKDKSEINENNIAVVWYAYGMSLTLKQEYSLSYWKTVWQENIWKLEGRKKDNVGEYSVMRNVTICICLPTSFQSSY